MGIKKDNKRLISIGVCICIFMQIFSQGIRHEFSNITVEDGLPHSTVTDLLQDHVGYIWVGTLDGLTKFDSHKFTTYKKNPGDSSSISSNQIFSLYEDRKEQLWVGTKSSLELYNRQKNSFKSFLFVNKNEKFVEKVPVIDIIQYSDSLYLVGTDGGGVYVFNPYLNSYKQYKIAILDSDTVQVTQIFDISIDRNNNIWLASTDAGLVRLELSKEKLIVIPKEDKSFLNLRALIDFSDSTFLLGAYGGGLWFYDYKNNNYLSPFSSFVNYEVYMQSLNRIFSLYFDTTTGNYFIGTDGGGLFEYKPRENKLEQYQNLGYNPYSISNNAVKAILIDSENNLWAGHFRGGLSFSAKHKPFYNIRYNPAMSNSLSNNLVSAILMDKGGNMLIGTDGGGLNILNKDGTIQNKLTNDNKIIKQLPVKSIIALYKDRNNKIWIGTYLDGLYLYTQETGTVKRFGATDSEYHRLSNDDIRCFFEDRDGKMWIGTNGGGINIFDPQTDSIEVIQRDENNLDNSLSLDWIHSIIEDSYGYIWIGTAYGVNRYDPVNKRFMKYIHNPSDTTSISNDFVFCVYEDSDKNLWVGTTSGLNLLERSDNSFIHYTIENGLPDNLIYDMEEDSDKNIWIITNNGLSKLNLESRTFSNFDVDDGLLSNTFINGSMCKTNDGLICVGSVKGLSYFKPEEIYQSIHDAPFLITDFKIFNQPVPINKEFNGIKILNNHISYTDEIEISYKENVISFEYTALSFSSANKIKYAYCLENFDIDNKFNETNERSVTYTNLRPGDYTFIVKTTNLAHNIEKKVKIKVTPPFYQRLWFKILLTIIIIGVIYYWNNNRVLQIKSQKDALEIRMSEEKLRHEKEEISLRNEKLKSEMNYKNAQLTSFALLISHKNDIMREIKSKLTAFARRTQSEELDNELTQLVEAIDNEFKVEEDWLRFEEHFNQIHKDFFNRLKYKYTDLSPTYLKLSAYIRLNLSSKEIASLMNISVRGVEKARSRLRKRLELSQNESLNVFISSI